MFFVSCPSVTITSQAWWQSCHAFCLLAPLSFLMSAAMRVASCYLLWFSVSFVCSLTSRLVGCLQCSRVSLVSIVSGRAAPCHRLTLSCTQSWLCSLFSSGVVPLSRLSFLLCCSCFVSCIMFVSRMFRDFLCVARCLLSHTTAALSKAFCGFPWCIVTAYPFPVVSWCHVSPSFRVWFGCLLKETLI